MCWETLLIYSGLMSHTLSCSNAHSPMKVLLVIFFSFLPCGRLLTVINICNAGLSDCHQRSRASPFIQRASNKPTDEMRQRFAIIGPDLWSRGPLAHHVVPCRINDVKLVSDSLDPARQMAQIQGLPPAF